MGIGAIAIVTLGIGILLYFMQTKETAACRGKVPLPTIVAFGDSLIRGYGATTDGGFISLLSQQIGIPIDNLGRNGETTEGGLGRINLITQKNPDIVILLLGGNDALQRAPVATTEQNLGSIISQVRAQGSQVVLLGVTGGLLSDPYKNMFARLAKTEGVTYVPNVLSGIIGREEFMSDSIHPNEGGYQKIALKVLPALEEACADL